MKCYCGICEGRGANTSIQDAQIWRDCENLMEFTALQNDAFRANKQAEQLIAMNPNCSISYRDQLWETLRTINDQADNVSKRTISVPNA